MSRKKRKALFKRFRLLTVSEEEKRRNITASVMETARKQRETVYGIKAEENAPAGTEAAETIETSDSGSCDIPDTEPDHNETDSE